MNECIIEPKHKGYIEYGLTYGHVNVVTKIGLVLFMNKSSLGNKITYSFNGIQL